MTPLDFYYQGPHNRIIGIFTFDFDDDLTVVAKYQNNETPLHDDQKIFIHRPYVNDIYSVAIEFLESLKIKNSKSEFHRLTFGRMRDTALVRLRDQMPLYLQMNNYKMQFDLCADMLML